MNHCANCAAPLPAGAEFCPRCGKNLNVPAATPAPPPAHRAPWWIVPLVIVGLIVIAFLVLMGLPFGGREPERRSTEIAPTETIAEADPIPASPPAESGTLVEVGEEPVTEPAPVPSRVEPKAPVAKVPPPRVVPKAPVAKVPPPRVETPPPAEEIGVSEAMSTLRSFITSRDYYGVGADCIGVSSLGYQNTGYTLEVRNACSSRTLGRWRVDSKTREIFRQREDGRYLRP